MRRVRGETGWFWLVPIVLGVGMMAFSVVMSSRGVRPESGKVFSVFCSSGENILWRADDVWKYERAGGRGDGYFVFQSKTKGTARVDASCVITEIDAP